MITFEVCLQSPEDAVAAQTGGAQRVELCAALIEGGLTPSYGTILSCRKAVDIDIMVMIRPRGGDFLYSELELESMERDIEFCKSVGVTGVVFGLLLPDGQIDAKNTHKLCALARPLSVTFHRAFDVCKDPSLALEQLIDIGVDRVLTSGQKATVPEGLVTIKSLIDQSQGRIGILPGCGITPDNVAKILSETGLREFHATAFRIEESNMRFRNEEIYMGVPGLPEYQYQRTSSALVKEFMQTIRHLEN